MKYLRILILSLILVLTFFFILDIFRASAQTPVTPTWQVPSWSADEYPVISNAPFSSAGSMVYPVGYGVYFTSAGTVYSAFIMQETATGSEIYSAGDSVTVSSYSRSDMSLWPDDTYSAFFCLVDSNYVCDFSGVDIHDINQLSGVSDVYAFNVVVSSGVATLSPYTPPAPPAPVSHVEIWSPTQNQVVSSTFVDITGYYWNLDLYDYIIFELEDKSTSSISEIPFPIPLLNGSQIPFTNSLVLDDDTSYAVRAVLWDSVNDDYSEYSAWVDFSVNFTCSSNVFICFFQTILENVRRLLISIFSWGWANMFPFAFIAPVVESINDEVANASSSESSTLTWKFMGTDVTVFTLDSPLWNGIKPMIRAFILVSLWALYVFNLVFTIRDLRYKS